MSVLKTGIKFGMYEALIASMRVVRMNQRNLGLCITRPYGLITKDDTTIVTTADIDSDQAGKDVLRKIPGIRVHGEESGVEGSSESGITVYLDGLDGSMPYALGALTSTVIVSATDETGKVVYCLVGQPATGRVWKGGVEDRTEMWYVDGTIEDYLSRPIFVRDTPLSGSTRVLIDSYPGFTRKGLNGKRVILSIKQLDELHTKIQSISGFLALGSNGLHHALVAGGGSVQPSAITTAIGGPWDVAPVLLVTQAGGSARAFHVTDNGEFEDRDPLAIATYDILVTGNKESVAQLSEMILSLRR